MLPLNGEYIHDYLRVLPPGGYSRVYISLSQAAALHNTMIQRLGGTEVLSRGEMDRRFTNKGFRILEEVEPNAYHRGFTSILYRHDFSWYLFSVDAGYLEPMFENSFYPLAERFERTPWPKTIDID